MSKQPHTAVILMKIEVFPNLPTGECSGNPLLPNELKSHGIEPTMLLKVTGFDKFECFKKLKEALATLQK